MAKGSGLLLIGAAAAAAVAFLWKKKQPAAAAAEPEDEGEFFFDAPADWRPPIVSYEPSGAPVYAHDYGSDFINYAIYGDYGDAPPPEVKPDPSELDLHDPVPIEHLDPFWPGNENVPIPANDEYIFVDPYPPYLAPGWQGA